MIVNSKELRAWRSHLGLMQTEAAKILGMNPQTYRNYERGVRTVNGKRCHVHIPSTVGLACAAVLKGLHNTRLRYMLPTPKKDKAP